MNLPYNEYILIKKFKNQSKQTRMMEKQQKSQKNEKSKTIFIHS
jgi:hypothetical protein